MKTLLILKCSDSRKWYRCLVGSTVPFLGEENSEYRTRQPSGFINFVSKKDATLVEVDDIEKIRQNLQQ